MDELIENRVEEFKEVLKQVNQDSDEAIIQLLEEKRASLKQSIHLLDILSPLSALRRGYAIIRQDEKVITSAKGLKSKTELSTEFKDGEVISVISKVKLK